MIPEAGDGTIACHLYLGDKHLDAGCLTNSLKLKTVSLVFLSLCVKSFCVICFITGIGREAKQTKFCSEKKHMNPLNI